MLELPNNDGDVIDRAGKILSGPWKAARGKIPYTWPMGDDIVRMLYYTHYTYYVVLAHVCHSDRTAAKKKNKERKNHCWRRKNVFYCVEIKSVASDAVDDRVFIRIILSSFSVSYSSCVLTRVLLYRSGNRPFWKIVFYHITSERI